MVVSSVMHSFVLFFKNTIIIFAFTPLYYVLRVQNDEQGKQGPYLSYVPMQSINIEQVLAM